MPSESARAAQAGFEVGPGLPRPVDFVAALAGLLLTLPLIGIAALAIAVTSRGPVIFRQTRAGRRGHPFVLYKLRTMAVDSAGPKITARADSRVTAVGRVLRRIKADELPQLWNVLTGDMALVGPRPEVPEYVDAAAPEWRAVLEARPGITDPMTLELRNEEDLLATVAEDREDFYLNHLQPFKLRGYLTYLQTRTWRTDIRILIETLVAVIRLRAAPPGPDAVLSANLARLKEQRPRALSRTRDHRL
jgi:lipopolysaccharide/colanic/teichoic acid biosynthesis glycosyltransferase